MYMQFIELFISYCDWQVIILSFLHSPTHSQDKPS